MPWLANQQVDNVFSHGLTWRPSPTSYPSLYDSQSQYVWSFHEILDLNQYAGQLNYHKIIKLPNYVQSQYP